MTNVILKAAKLLIENGAFKRSTTETLNVGESTLRKILTIEIGVVALSRFKQTFNDKKEKRTS